MVTKGKKFRWCAALAAAAVLAVSMAGLAACGSDDEEIVGEYVYGEEGGYTIEKYSMTIDTYDSYLLRVYDDDTYELFFTQSMSMYGEYITIVVQTDGTYTTGKDDDDYTVYTLSEAEEIDYKTAGMYELSVNSATSTFPAELLGGDYVEADEFAEMYGQEMSVTIGDSGTTFTIS